MDSLYRSQIADRKKKSVSFDNVDILEFKLVVGDNPCVSTGPPVALAPDLERRTLVDIDAYEGTRRPRRNLIGMAMSCKDRERILLKNGAKKDEMAKAITQANSVKVSREQSFQSMDWDKVSEIWEGSTRQLMRTIGLRSSAKKLFLQTQTSSIPTDDEKDLLPEQQPQRGFRAGRRVTSSSAA